MPHEIFCPTDGHKCANGECLAAAGKGERLMPCENAAREIAQRLTGEIYVVGKIGTKYVSLWAAGLQAETDIKRFGVDAGKFFEKVEEKASG